MEEIKNRPLVSVAVLTYNSSSYIIETLESIKAQDYPNLELVISDDGSIDDTCQIIEDWLGCNNEKFKRAILIRSFRNKGTCKNYNQAVINTHGVYVKTLDGDDCLSTRGSISTYVDFCQQNNAEICVSDVELFSEGEFDKKYYRPIYDYYIECINEPYECQKERIICELAIPDPALFFSRNLFDHIGGFDENYLLQEEWPFFYKAINQGFRVFGVNAQLVKYRISPKSATHGRKKSFATKMCIKDNLDFLLGERFWQMAKRGKILLALRQLIALLRDYLYQIV